MRVAGYNAILISTIVDPAARKMFTKAGYNAILISTIVDTTCEALNPSMAIMLF